MALGRWLQRDPAGYIDGLNFYEYAVANPIILADPTGECGEPTSKPALTDNDKRIACDNYKKEHPQELKDLWGGVLCVEGKKVTCSWRPSSGEPTADAAIDACIHAHERKHFGDTDCGKDEGSVEDPTRLPFRKGKVWAEQEVYAHQAENNCLQNALKQCDFAGDPHACKEAIRVAIKQNKEWEEYYRQKWQLIRDQLAEERKKKRRGAINHDSSQIRYSQ